MLPSKNAPRYALQEFEMLGILVLKPKAVEPAFELSPSTKACGARPFVE